MPQETMTDDEHVILLAKLDELVGIVPVVAILLRMNGFALHAVLGNDAVEVACDDAVGLLVLARRLIHIDGTTHEELTIESLFQCERFLRLRCATSSEQTECSEQYRITHVSFQFLG